MYYWVRPTSASRTCAIFSRT